MPTLSQKTIEAAKPGASRYELRDSKVPGLRLVVQTSGVRTWALRYRLKNGRAGRFTIGALSEALGLEQARKLAAEKKLEIIRGVDPAAERRAARHRGTTVQAVWDEYRDLHLSQRRASTAAAANTLFRNTIIPRWGKLEIASIKRRDVMALLDGMRGEPARAIKAKVRLGHFFGWCVEREIIEVSPVANVKTQHKAQSRDRVLTDTELRRVWCATDKAGYPFGQMVKILILTMARRTEVAAMTWKEIKEKERLWSISEDRTKNAVAMEVHLTTAAMKVLASVPRTGSHVFTTRDDKPVSGFAKMKSRLEELIGDDMEHWTLHDLRRTGSTILQRLGFSKEVIDACQNHKLQGIAAVYQRYQFKAEKVRAFEALSREVTRIVTDRNDSNILPFAVS